jgi:hypothetical protein
LLAWFTRFNASCISLGETTTFGTPSINCCACLPNLNQAQRDEFNKQINQATQVPDVNAIQQAANQLNEAMTALKQGIANKDDIKDSENSI